MQICWANALPRCEMRAVFHRKILSRACKCMDAILRSHDISVVGEHRRRQITDYELRAVAAVLGVDMNTLFDV